ncbi:DMT family transporter [Herbiconiux moechotypicola]|uniref:DMT family transporter n=1 Tax=Herbiconiux moechotypicola TaxID=637393 RepID=A0ABN3DMW8_9MICO
MTATVSLVAATLFWAGNYVVGETAVTALDPVSLVLLRWAFAAVPLLVIAQLVERPRWREVLRAWRWIVVLGLLGVLGYTLILYEALRFTDAFSASVINAFNPAMISIAAVLFLRQRLGLRAIAGIVIALVGVLIVLSRGSVEVLLEGGFGLGDLLMVGAGVAWTAYTIVGRRAPAVPPITSTALQAVVAVIAIAPVSLALGGPAMPPDASVWGALAFIVVFPSVLSYLLWNRALEVVPPARAGVFLNLITVFTALLTLLTGHPLGAAQIIGGVVVIAGIVLTNLSPSRRARGPAAGGGAG